MANEQNLIPLTERGKEDAKRIRQMGQAAQVASRRRKRTLKECADYYLALPPADDDGTKFPGKALIRKRLITRWQ